MDISKIIVSYTETANLGNYSNVRPGVTLEVTLGEGDDPALAQAEALAQARTIVQSAVDDALEANDQEPRYTTEQRYTVYVRHKNERGGTGALPRIAVIAPSDADPPHPSFSRMYGAYRLAKIRQMAQRHNPGLLIDTTIDPDALPPLIEQIAAEESELEAARERERRRWSVQADPEPEPEPADADEDDEDDDEDDEL